MKYSKEFTTNSRVVEIANEIGPDISYSVLERVGEIGAEKALKLLNSKSGTVALISTAALTVAAGIGAGVAIAAPKIKARFDLRKNALPAKTADNEAKEENDDVSSQNV